MDNEYLRKPLPSEEKQQDFYQKLRVKVHNWLENRSSKLDSAGQFVFFAPDLFHLLTRLMLDGRIDKKSKAYVGAGILYFMAPVDLIPEVLIGPAGYMDDVIVAVYVINTVLNRFPKEVITEHWAGDEDLLKVLGKLADSGNKLTAKLPAGKAIKRFLK
ncbi:MAG: YkvA family protein [Bacillota bacterium]